MKTRKVVFDMDGVLVDLWGLMHGVYAQYIEQDVSDEQWDDVIKDYLINPLKYKDFGAFFNQSDALTKLPAIFGMPYVVRKLKDAGYKLAVLTSFSSEPDLVAKRKQNLVAEYGNMFDEIVCVDGNSQKAEALRSMVEGFDETYFIDDYPKNVFSGEGIVSKSIWFQNRHQQHLWYNGDNQGCHQASDTWSLLKLICNC